MRALPFSTLVAFGPQTSYPSSNGVGGVKLQTLFLKTIYLTSAVCFISSQTIFKVKTEKPKTEMRSEVVVVVSHIQRIGCQPPKNYFTRWPFPLVVC